MQETPTSFSHLESPIAGATLPAGQHMLRGWVWPKAGGLFVDVRARIGSHTFPGIHGLPRADLALHFHTGRAVALAEFYVVVTLTAGRAQLFLEVLSIEGAWSIFQTIHYDVTTTLTPPAVAMPTGVLRWHEYGRALQLLLRQQRCFPAASLRELARNLVADIPHPRDLRHPHLPFHGHLDEPAAITRCGFGRTTVLGYLFHETQPIKRVLATFDLQAWQTIEHDQPSPGPASYYPAFTTAKNCGLFGIIDVPAQLPNPVCLRLYAELNDGSLHLCSVQRSRLYTHEDEKIPYPAQDNADFATTHEALTAALAERHIEVMIDQEMQKELAQIETDFKSQALRSRPIVSPLISAPTSTAPLPRHILLVTHNLNREGAPLFLIDYAEHLAQAGAAVTILSPMDGPLRSRFEQFGAQIKLLDVSAILTAPTAQAAHEAIRQLGRAFDFTAFDLVVGNTFTTFWAVHAAKAAQRRVLLYVHESTTPASFYIGRMAPEVIALVTAAFALADCVSFTTAATRAYHLDYGRPTQHRLTPGWIDLARIDAWRAKHPRATLRAQFGLQPHELLVTNVGTVCDRKGQHIFARAVDLLWRRYPALAARTRFIMLGGGETPFDAVLADLLTHLGRTNLNVHPGTSDYFPYYAAADLFVCSTYEESSPRVILEAMACSTPILSSDVHGIPEQVLPSLEAKLVPPGDTVALCEGMAELLLNPEMSNEYATRARTRIANEFAATIGLPRHACLARAVTAGTF